MANALFIGKDPTVAAYESRGIEVWGICQGKQLITAGTGKDELEQFLEMLENAGPAPLYTLKVYSHLQDANEVTDKTPSNGSFPFKLGDQAGLGVMGGVGNYSLYAQIAGLQKEIKELKEGGPKEKKTFGDVVAGWFETPEDVMTIVQAGRLLFGKGPIEAPAMGTLGTAVENQGAVQSTVVKNHEQEMQLLASAIDRLQKADPKIVEHLCKLADMAEKNPTMFQFLIKNLDGI